jgi:hypothetical protein
MSIIQEALKKAEKHIKNPKQAGVAPAAPVSSVSSADQSFVKAPRPAAGQDPKAVAILLIILVVTAVFAASQLAPKKNISEKPSVADEAVTKPAAVSSKGEGLPVLPSVIFQQPPGNAATLRPADQPSARAEEKKPAASEFVLNGIMYLEGSPRAIINDSMVEAGDTVDGARVVKIDKRNVLLEYNGAQLSLDLK